MDKDNLLYLAGVEAHLHIHTSEDVTETKLLSRLREMELRHTAQSEGYETMTHGSSDITSEVKKTFCIWQI